MRVLQLKTKAETIALGKCDAVSEHPAFPAVHMEWDSNERSQIRNSAEQKVLLQPG